MLQFIPVEKIHPHPDNPRKQMGDLAELANSIKQNGILQNLTVVPNIVTGEITGEQWQRGYTVIIGHRRLAAAKRARLTEVPCIVADMTQADQVRTMLMENIQREDLTVYEQAQGFQMMLDLGDTVDSLAEKSGFSSTTVRRRVKLLELDDKKFKKSQERGATLFDYMELDKLERLDLKDEVLGSIGTANFKDKLKSAINREKQEAYLAGIIATASTFAVEITTVDRDVMTYVRNYGNYTMGQELVIPEDAQSARYYYKVSDTQVDIYKDKPDIPTDDEAERREAERAENRARYEAQKKVFCEITERHATLRREFVASVNKTSIKAHLGDITAAIIFSSVGSTDYYRANWVNEELLAQIADIELDLEAEDEDQLGALEYHATNSPERMLLATAYAMLENSDYAYWREEWVPATQQYTFVPKEVPRLDRCYEFLAIFGYEMSDEEKAMQDGTHEIFPEKEKEPECD